MTNCGANVLLRNDGAGRFTDVTIAAGVGDPGWGASAAFVDYDHATKVSTVIEEQDCTSIIEHNKDVANSDHTKQGIKKGWLHLGTIPANLIQQFSIESGLDPYTREGLNYIIKKIHERDYSLLKVADGRFIRAN